MSRPALLPEFQIQPHGLVRVGPLGSAGLFSISSRGLGLGARTGHIVCLAGSPFLAADPASQLLVRFEKSSNINETCKARIAKPRTAEFFAIDARITVALGPVVAKSRGLYLSSSAQGRSDPQPLAA
jgi:hypothetical protein